VELKTGSKGRFEVTLNGQEVFSKASLDRFPAPGEVVKLLEPRLGPPPSWRSGHK
jgi:selT/selW/selH-like putative selenoprotein